jgi:hypothetical protein
MSEQDSQQDDQQPQSSQEAMRGMVREEIALALSARLPPGMS